MYLCSEIAKRDVTNMELMGMPLWTWVVFYILVFIMLIIDLKMFARKGEHEVNISEALKMTAVWIAVSLVFCAGIYLWYPVDPHGKAMEFWPDTSSRSRCRWTTSLCSSCSSPSSA